MPDEHNVAAGFLFASGVAGCVAPLGASSVSIPRDARIGCAAQCGQTGMGLRAVAIMANNIACVCRGGGFVAPASGPTWEAEATGRRRGDRPHGDHRDAAAGAVPSADEPLGDALTV